MLEAELFHNWNFQSSCFFSIYVSESYNNIFVSFPEAVEKGITTSNVIM